MRLLDLYCGAGGASKGYADAGFQVVGVDIAPQPHYPYEFHQADALEYPLDGFHVIHASPPCQKFSTLTKGNGREWAHPDLIGPTRERLKDREGFYVIENVEGAPLVNPLTLCGSSFGLRVRRHRLFESNAPLFGKPCDHHWQNQNPIYPTRVSKKRGLIRMTGTIGIHGALQLYQLGIREEMRLAKEAMGIDWLGNNWEAKWELNESIPPAYTEYLGSQLMMMLLGRTEKHLASL